uniref:Uncharacterized protein n=1 Tax=Rhizophora mucronata TaxID=61149 RepID=A0A2P2N582_RHIMU
MMGYFLYFLGVIFYACNPIVEFFWHLLLFCVIENRNYLLCFV